MDKPDKPKIDNKVSDSRKVLNFDDVQGFPNNNKSRTAKKASEAAPDVSTGAIHKKKNAYRTIKPSNSFKQSDGSHFYFSLESKSNLKKFSFSIFVS